MTVSARLAADIGGTFTDIVLETGRQRLSHKILTTPRAPERALLEGVQTLLSEAQLKPSDIDLFIHGTTLATNAIIERKGAKTALLTTQGFRDVLATGYEKRFDQNSVFFDAPEPLVPRQLRFTVPERVSARGEVLVPLDEQALQALAEKLAREQIEALAIGFLHAYRYPEHEQRAAEIIAAAVPSLSVSLSSEVCPELREYERFSTTCANAYVRPLLQGYLYRLRDALDAQGMRCPLLLMTSGGGLAGLETAARLPIRLVESGPAGGALLAARIAAECGLDQVLSFDMGGTTAKICLLQYGQPQRARRFEVARVHRHMKGSGLPLRIPVIEMIEIGAGGGSVARVDSLGKIAVGPDSAGAEPGPVCYGRGGTRPTVTDANLLLGRLDPASFAGGRIVLRQQPAERALAEQIGAASGLTDIWPAVGVIEMVDENMANAARVHAVERGKVIERQTLIAFGGGAPLHAATIAVKLGISTVVIPSGAGVGSAIGFLRAPVSYEVVRSLPLPLPTSAAEISELLLATINTVLAEMRAEAEAVVVPAVAAGTTLRDSRTVDMRYKGQGQEIALPLPGRPLTAHDLSALRSAFETRYQQRYGLILTNQALEAVTWSLNLTTEPDPPPPVAAAEPAAAPEPEQRRAIYDPVTGERPLTPVYRRDRLLPGCRFDGPALVAEAETASYVPTGFTLRVDGHGYLILTRQAT